MTAETSIKKLISDSLSGAGKINFILFLTLLFFINFSIAVCNIVFFLIILLSVKDVIRNKTHIFTPPFFIYLLIFILITLISTLFSIDIMNSIRDNKELFIYLLIPIIPLILTCREKIEISLLTVFVSSLLSALAGIAVTIYSGISLSHRLKGFTSHWMTYSGLLMLSFVFFLIYSIYLNKSKKKTYFFLALALILVSIILSLTRSVWVGIFISLLLYFMVYSGRRSLFITIGIFSLTILLIVLTPPVKKRIGSIFDPNNTTNKDRIYMAYTTIRIVGEFPLTGVGPDNVKEIYPHYKHPKATKNNQHLHNNFFQIIAEKGVFALITFILFIISILRSLWKLSRSGDNYVRSLSISVLSMFLAFLVAGMFEYNFGDSEIKFLLFYFISIPYLSEKITSVRH